MYVKAGLLMWLSVLLRVTPQHRRKKVIAAYRKRYWPAEAALRGALLRPYNSASSEVLPIARADTISLAAEIHTGSCGPRG